MYVLHVGAVPTRFELYVFNTKGKPSIFIRTPQDERLLINGGANSDVVGYLTKAIPFYSRRIDTIILTQDDGDDATGLIDIVNRYKIGSVIIPALTTRSLSLSSSTDQIYETFIDTVKKTGISTKEVKRGDVLSFAGFTIEILFPESISQPTSTSTKNFVYSKASLPELVLKISYGHTSFLFVEDSSTKIQKFMVQNSSTSTLLNSLLSNVLIIPHSVSANSLSLDLMNNVQPEFVVYSQALGGGKSKTASSKNKKTDPLYMILEDHRFNVKQKNTVKVFSDGESVEII